MFSPDFVNLILGSATLLGQVIIVVVIFCLLTGTGKSIVDFFTKRALWMMFLVALVATSGSLTYSEILGYEPCYLCWFQRIFMYPQTILFGLALYKKDNKIFDYGLALSGVGILYSIYHYLLQWGFVPELSCSVVGVSCAKQFVTVFGYITIPLMALTAFALIILHGYLAKRAVQN
ncbi:MAG: disulfide bond formation protein B [Patescibacteria group bacterium]